ncbi:hypothetical protein MRX96_006304 [Rhipicephalus microplus]
MEYVAEREVLLRRCPCGQVVNPNDASQILGWKVRRDVSIQCDLQEMAPLPLPREVFPSAAHVESIRKGTSCNPGWKSALRVQEWDGNMAQAVQWDVSSCFSAIAASTPLLSFIG